MIALRSQSWIGCETRSQRTGEVFNPLLDRYVALRFLGRLARSTYSDQYLLKGATMFLLWLGEMHRTTRDIDLLGILSLDEQKLATMMHEIITLDDETDGVAFEPDSLTLRPIMEQQSNIGIRVNVTGYIGKARVPLQIDIGYGDAVTPAPASILLPGLIRGVAAMEMWGYAVETAFAEKFEAMVGLGIQNSRMKDFFDLATIIRSVPVRVQALEAAIEATFARRGRSIPRGLPLALTAEFYEDKQVLVRWNSFSKKNRLESPLDDLTFVCSQIAEFIAPVLASTTVGQIDRE